MAYLTTFLFDPPDFPMPTTQVYTWQLY